jgi:hypothetical protein
MGWASLWVTLYQKYLGRCYYNNFLRFLQIFGQKWRLLFLKKCCVSIFLKPTGLWTKNANFCRQKIYFLNHNIWSVVTPTRRHLGRLEQNKSIAQFFSQKRTWASRQVCRLGLNFSVTKMQEENKIAPAASSHTVIQIRPTSLSASSRQIRTKELG